MINREAYIDGVGTLVFDLPDICPRCGKAFSPEIVFVNRNDKIFKNADKAFSAALTCNGCGSLSVSKHHPANNGYCALIKCEPVIPAPREFTAVVHSISPNFIEIYNQAKKAEDYGLGHIAGMGYRKALEFLVKDYAIKTDPGKEDEIKSAMLGPCIKKYIDDKYVKQSAKAASWVGNDETHYQRLNEDKDIADLKRYLDSCLFFIMAIMNTEESREMTDTPSKPE